MKRIIKLFFRYIADPIKLTIWLFDGLEDRNIKVSEGEFHLWLSGLELGKRVLLGGVCHCVTGFCSSHLWQEHQAVGGGRQSLIKEGKLSHYSPLLITWPKVPSIHRKYNLYQLLFLSLRVLQIFLIGPCTYLIDWWLTVMVCIWPNRHFWFWELLPCFKFVGYLRRIPKGRMIWIHKKYHTF